MFRRGQQSWLVVGLYCLLTLRPVDAAAAPMAWSSDGEWISYVVETQENPCPIPTAWIFGPSVENSAFVPAARPINEAPALRVARLWATERSSKTSLLLEQTTGVITPPGWSLDRHSLAFGRITPTELGRGRFEVICIDGPNRRTLFSQPIDDWSTDAGRLSRWAVAWSPDGRFIAIPQIKPAGLAILRTDTGRVIKTIESASLPVWAPDGSKLLYISSGDEDRLECLESHFGASRHLADLGQVDGPPLFSRDGQTVAILTRKRIDRGAAPPFEQVDLWRIRVDDGRKDRITTLGTTTRDQVLSATSLTQDRDSENLFSTLTIDGQPSQVTWFRPRERSVYKKFPVLDTTLPIEDLSLSPSGGTLVLRLGGAGPKGLPMFCDVDTMQLTPLTPDDASRAAWTSRLLGTLEDLLREVRPNPIVAGRAVDRPVALPIPGELDANSDPVQRLRRLGRLGHILREAEGYRHPEEIDFLFDYLREDFPAALHDLESLEANEVNPERRLRMLNLRAQVDVGLGEFEKAKGIYQYLKTDEQNRRRRLIESTSRGFFLSNLTMPTSGWADYAFRRVETQEREAVKEAVNGTIEPTDHRNPDNPLPGLGLDPEPPPAPRRGLALPPVPQVKLRPRPPVIPGRPAAPF